MEIGNHGLLSPLQGVEPNTNALQPSALQAGAPTQDFSALLTNALEHVNGLQGNSSELTTRLELGDKQITLADTMIAKEKASVAFEATVQVRNKLVEAYKEVMSMPV